MNKVIKTINQFNMFENTNCIVVGVSGGADSMMLLSVLIKIAYEKGMKIIAAHINHMLRGSESKRDENFVRNFCSNQKIPLKVLKIDVKNEALKMSMGLEECGRNIRYQFFNKLALKENAKIATAHNLSDNVETVILNITRGTGLKGLCGIPPVRDNIIRPLIFLTKKEILTYCNKNSIHFIVDSSNLSKDYSRNKVRLDIIPVLKQINPSLENNVLKMTKQMHADYNYLNNIAKNQIEKIKSNDGYSIKMLLNLELPIVSRCIILIAKQECNINLESVHLDLIIKNINNGFGSVTIKNNAYAIVKNDFLTIKKVKKSKPILWANKLIGSKILTETGRQFIIDIINFDEYNKRIALNSNLKKNAIDYKSISDYTVLRNRRSGDVFKKHGRNVTKSLKKFFNEEKIDIPKRNEIAVIANNNQVLWVEGFGASEFSAVNKNTQKIAMIFAKGCNNVK